MRAPFEERGVRPEVMPEEFEHERVEERCAMLGGWHKPEGRAERIASAGLPESTGDVEGIAAAVPRLVLESGAEAGAVDTRDGLERRRSGVEVPQLGASLRLEASYVSRRAVLARPVLALQALPLLLRLQVQAQVHLRPRHLHLDRDQTRPGAMTAAASVWVEKVSPVPSCIATSHLRSVAYRARPYPGTPFSCSLQASARILKSCPTPPSTACQGTCLASAYAHHFGTKYMRTGGAWARAGLFCVASSQSDGAACRIFQPRPESHSRELWLDIRRL